MRKIIISIFIILGSIMPVSFAYAQFNSVCTDKNITAGSPSQSPICKDTSTTNPIASSSGGIIGEVVNILAVIAGIVAVIMIVVAGFMYVLSGGESQKINQAKNTIIFALIGLAVIILAKFIIVFVVSLVTK